MAQRLAVLLAVASILIIACAADEPAAAYKYEKKSHVRNRAVSASSRHASKRLQEQLVELIIC
jgi:hypothetical protein